MDQKKQLVLAFDHELPLGGITGTYDQAIFEPTRQVIESANKLGVKVCLFTDILSLLFFRKHLVPEFTEPYTRQLQYALECGHEVQLHLHPHWIDTRLENGRFVPSGSFGLGDFAGKGYPGNIEGIVAQGVQELTAICRTVRPDYQCIAFRAGGFNLHPETSRILTALHSQGIRIDSSIPRDFYYRSAFSEINYKNTPEPCNWTIPLSGPVNGQAENGLLEVPIATKPAGLITNLKHLYNKKKYSQRAYVTGKTLHSGNVSKLDKLRFVFSVRMLGFDTWTMNVNDLIKILQYNLQKYRKDESIILSSVSHPKNMGRYSIGLMEAFILDTMRKHPDLQFTTFEEINMTNP
ncbi:MAG: hypothetical protein NTU44_11555 [Bacteroidetes bacterium]|nr:hypothetical protein [Bacteroidota bacterium]